MPEPAKRFVPAGEPDAARRPELLAHPPAPHRRHDDRGEGVVSAAIVVLIMAALGALMWLSFRGMWEGIESDTNDRIDEVGT